MDSTFIERYVLEKTKAIPDFSDINVQVVDKRLVATENIKKGTLFLKFKTSESIDCNDGCFDISHIDSTSSLSLYNSLFRLEQHYYENAENRVNVKEVTDGNSSCFVAIKDIFKDEEILRCYGFSSWLCLGDGECGNVLLEIITPQNVAGFANFLYHWYCDRRNFSDSNSIDIVTIHNKIRKALEGYSSWNNREYDSDPCLSFNKDEEL